MNKTMEICGKKQIQKEWNLEVGFASGADLGASTGVFEIWLKCSAVNMIRVLSVSISSLLTNDRLPHILLMWLTHNLNSPGSLNHYSSSIFLWYDLSASVPMLTASFCQWVRFFKKNSTVCFRLVTEFCKISVSLPVLSATNTCRAQPSSHLQESGFWHCFNHPRSSAKQSIRLSKFF